MKPSPPIRVLCVDDHPIVLEGLCALIGTQPDMAIVGEATNGHLALARYREVSPDVVVMDLKMPDLDGVDTIRLLRAEFPTARVVVFTTCEGDEDIHRALDAGALGFLVKDMARKELLNTIREVHAGRRCIPPEIASRLVEHHPRNPLSPRELEVLKHLATGLRNKEIGSSLGIAEDTVKIHVKNIFSKLNVIDRTQAVVTASQRGIIHLERVQ